MNQQVPPIVKLAERVLLSIEDAVGGFARKHKYAIGSELRRDARIGARLAHRAWRDQPRRSEWIQKLVQAVDDLKIDLQISQDLRAFRSFAQFEALARLISDLGRQCGGWHNAHRKGQSDRDRKSPGRRAQILSARDASQEANP